MFVGEVTILLLKSPHCPYPHYITIIFPFSGEIPIHSQVLEAKKVLSDFALRAWSPVAAQSSAEEFAQQLLPTALRMTMLGQRPRF